MEAWRPRQCYGPSDAGPACEQCGASSSVARWAHRRGSVYCLPCWKEWGSEAANTLQVCYTDPALSPPPSGAAKASVLYPEPPSAPQARSANGCGDAAAANCGKKRPRESSVCEVTPEDSLDATARVLREATARGDFAGGCRLPPVVLNMANAEWVGGGFLHDSSGQEEEMCRRTNLFPQLLQAEKEGQYPIPDVGAIVCPDVTVFRSGQKDNYAKLAEPYRVAVVTAAAPRSPDVSSPHALRSYVERMRAKVEALLAVLEHCGYEELVLSAWGCGAFRNPPEHVARIFRQALCDRFAHSFRRVVFAVYDRPDWPGEGNCGVFRREFDLEA